MRKSRPAGAQTFVVRVVNGDEAHRPNTWHATVVEVATGERRTVTSYAALAAFIEECRLREPTPRVIPS
jgi:hypothetical protein